MGKDESADTGKYEALCHVARGVIHDLNNALMVASCYIELAKLRGVKDAEMHAMLCEAVKACQSGINSTRRLSGSAGGYSAEKGPAFISGQAAFPARVSPLSANANNLAG